MKDNQAKYPQLRFKGFTDPWEERKLGDTETHFTDGNYGESYPSEKDMSDKANGIPFLRGSDFSNGYLDSSNANYIKPEKHAELTSGHIKQDDIVLAVRGSLGKLGYATKENEGWNINSQLAILRTNKSEISGMFLIQYLLGSKGQKEIFSRNTGTALKQLPIKQLKDIPVPVPTLLEQQKIGNFFKELDSTIALHQRKLAMLKELKQGYLQKLFPQNGSKFPQLRFAGFADAWEKRKLGDFIKIKSGKAWKSSEYTKFGNFLVVTIANVQGNYFINDQVGNHVHTNDRDQFILSFRDILISLTGNVGRVSRMTEAKAVLNQRVGKVIIISKKIDNEFLFQTMNCSKFEKQMILRGQGAAQLNITNKDVIDYRLTLPTTIDEQVSIGHILHLLDNLIAATQHKVDLLKKLKQGYLQKMFC